MAHSKNKYSKKQNLREEPRTRGASSRYNGRLFRNILETASLDECVDDNFKLRSDKEIKDIAIDIYEDIKWRSAEMRLIKLDREVKEKSKNFNREREFTDYVNAKSIEKDLRTRGRLKYDRYELTREELNLSKEKQKLFKKATKAKKRLLLWEFYNTDNFDIESLKIEYNVNSSVLPYDISDLAILISSTFKSLSDMDTYKNVRFLASLINVILVFSRSQDKLLRTSSIMLLIESLEINFSMKLISGLIASVVSFGSNIFENKCTVEYNMLEEMSNIQSTLDKVLHAEFAQALRQLIIGITTFLSFPREVASTVFDIMGTTPLKMSGIRLIETVIKVIVKIGRAASLWWYGRDGEAVPVSEILFGASMLETLREKYYLLETYKDYTYSGLPVDGHMCIYRYMRMASEFVRIGNAHLEMIGRHASNYRIIQSWVVSVNSWRLVLQNETNSRLRVPPFAVLLSGPPGVGKSLTLQLLASRPATIRGYKFDQSHVYYKNSSDPYWEGYKPSEHNVVFMSEGGKMKSSLAAVKGDEALDSFLSACDSNPYYVNMAFEGKGKTPFLAELFCVDANNKSLNFDELYANPAAFRRRIYGIEQRVKDEYKKSGSCEIDPVKVEHLENPFDAYLYRVYKVVPINVRESNEVTLLSNATYKDLVVHFDSAFISHQARNSKINRKVMDVIYSIQTDGTMPNHVTSFHNKPVDDELKDRTDGIYGLPEKPSYGKPAGERFFDTISGVKSHIEKYVKNGIIGNVTMDPFCDGIISNIESKVEDMAGYIGNNVILQAVDPSTNFGEESFSTIPENEFYKLYKRMKNLSDIVNREANSYVKVEEYLVHSEWKEMSCEVDRIFVDISKREIPYDKVNIALDNLEKDISLYSVDSRLRNDICMMVDSLFQQADKTRHESVKTDVFGNCIVRCYDMGYDLLVSLACYVFYKFLPAILYFHLASYKTILFWTVCVLCVTLSYFRTIVFVVMVFIFRLSFSGIVKKYTSRYISGQTRVLKARLYNVYAISCNYLFSTQKYIADVDHIIMLSLPNYKIFIGCAVISGLTVWRLLTNTLRNMTRYENAFSKYESPMKDLEEKTGCADPYSRVKLAQDPWNWNIQTNYHSSYPFTQSLEEFGTFIEKSTFRCELDTGGAYHKNHCIGLHDNFVLINTHYHKIARQEGLKIKCFHTSSPSVFFYITSEPLTYVDIGNDITIAMSTIRFKSMLKHISMTRTDHGEALIGGTSVAYNTIDRIQVGTDTHTNMYFYRGYRGLGLCGNVLCTVIGKSCAIVGMHIAGDIDGLLGYSTPLIRSQLEAGISTIHKSMGVFSPMVIPNSSRILKDKVPSLNKKSPFSHIFIPNVQYFGTYGPANVNRKSEVYRNCLSLTYEDISSVTGMVKTKEFHPPLMRARVSNGEYLSPQNNGLLNYTHPIEYTHITLAKNVLGYLEDKLYSRITSEIGDIQLSPYKVVYAVNGSPDDEYLRRINTSTAAGYGFPGKKMKYLPIVDEDKYVIRDVSTSVIQRMQQIIEAYSCGELSETIFSVSLKDEPVSKKKYDKGITRMFYVHETPHLILSRMYLGPIVTLIQQTDAFYSAVGINMYESADVIYAKLTKHPNYVENDAEKFDIRTSHMVKWYVSELILRLLKRLGYNDCALVIVRGLLSDLLAPFYMLDGDLFMKPSTPSGMYGTAELNCLIVLFMMVMTFYEKDAGDKWEIDFFEHVCAAFYGDDQSASVSNEASDRVNNFSLRSMYEKFGMKLTAADKESEMSKFVDISNATFLKRTFRYSSTFGRVIAPLDVNSIYKMTEWSVKSSSTTEIDHMVSVANSAIMEWFLHVCDSGSDRISLIRDIYIRRLQLTFGIDVSLKIFSIDKIYDIYKLNKLNNMYFEDDNVVGRLSGDMYLYSSIPPRIEYESACLKTVSMISAVKTRWDRHRRLDHLWCLKSRSAISYDDIKSEYESVLKMLSSRENPAPDVRTCDLKYLSMYAGDPHFARNVDGWLDLVNRKESLEILMEQNRMIKAKNYNQVIQYESLAEGYQKDGPVDSATVVTHDTLTEIGGAETKEIGDTYNNIKYIKTSNELNDFFSRPIQIGSFAIAPGGSYEYNYKIADLYLQDPAVRSKLRNFSFLRATMCARISVSGTPFDAGRLMVSPQPWANKNAVLTSLYNVAATWDQLRLVYLSQSKYSTVIDLKENKPIDIEMPWVSPNPVGRLFNQSTSALATGASLDDFTNMWTLYMKTLNPMTSCAASPANVYVYVYAYLKDVELGVPTGSQMAIVTNSLVVSKNSKQKKDERETGPIERISSALVTMSNNLTDIPIIAPYARASSIGFSAINKLSSLFGWSAPILLTTPQRIKSEPYQNGCAMIQTDTGQKICMDPKRELAISTEYVNVEKDELVISKMCEIQSYITTFTWPATGSPGVPLYSLAAHPKTVKGYTSAPSGTKNVVPTPMGFVSEPFEAWHGDIVFTLEAVVGAFHRGKLLIIYDPNIWQYANITANVNLNKQYSHVWDIQETQRYSICIPWNHVRTWAKNLTGSASYNTLLGSSLTPSQTLADAVNGFITILPFTKLQSPDSSDISINVYIHGENMQFNRVSTFAMNKNRAIQYNSEVTNVDSSCIPIARATVSSNDMAQHFYGESILSLRGLFKRFTGSLPVAVGSFVANGTYQFTGGLYNTQWGLIGTNSTDFQYMDFLTYFRFSFLAMRGSVRKRIGILFAGGNVNYPIYVSLAPQTTTPTNTIANTGAGVNSTSMSPEGSVMFVPSTNAGIEFELPFYSNNYFVYACSNDWTDFSNTPGCTTGTTTSYLVTFPLPGTPSYAVLHEMSAAGEDFQLSHFLGATPYVAP